MSGQQAVEILRRFAIEDLREPRDRAAQWQQIRAITGESSRLVWRSSPRQLTATTVLQVLAAGATGVQLLVDELMAAGGHYAELFQLQANTYLGRTPASSR